MTQRQDYKTVAPEAYAAMLGVETYVRKSGIEKPLLELVRTRASEINGCAYCLDMHTKEARAAGETEQRLYRGPRIIATDHQAPRVYPRMIPLCSRFDSVLFTPKMSAIASYGNFSRSPIPYLLGARLHSSRTANGRRLNGLKR
jgi:AhpD family alkylhydroperoxidase